jgi:hypothetical protein
MTIYGLCGAHRSGKTTVAKAIAEQMGIEFLDSSFNVAREFGYDPVAPMPLRKRVEMQALVFEHHMHQLDKAPRPLITDRTPVDFFAYLMAEFHMTSDRHAEADVLEAAALLAEHCLAFTPKTYDMVFFMEPLAVYEVDTTKATPPENKAFQLHIDALMRGGLSRIHDDLNYAFVKAGPLQERVDCVIEQIVERMNEITDLKQQAGFH